MRTRRLFAALAAVLTLSGACARAPEPASPAAAPRSLLAPDTSWVRRSVLYEVFVQDFSPPGDFRGLMAGLDRIEAAGANTLWLMPIHPIGVVNRKGTLGSPYAARDFRAINPAYGTAEDFRALVAAVHSRGMKLILDWVPDHTSPDHPWVTEHPDYYFRNERGEPMVPRDASGKLTDWTDVVQLDYGNPAVRREMIATMRWWIEEFGIDGYRVDVAGFLPYDFYREALPVLRAAAPRPLLLLAEWGDLELHRTGFDLTYAWDSYSRLKAAWRGGPASEFVAAEITELLGMPPGGMRLRFTTNHDQTASEDPPLVVFGGVAGARAAFVATALLPGRPLLYNGQEVESPQKLPLFERELIVWNQPDSAAALAFYRKVLDLARTDAAFLQGDFREAATTAPADVIAYRRGDALVLVNARNHPVRFAVDGFEVDGARDLLTGTALSGGAVELPPYGWHVLAARAR